MVTVKKIFCSLLLLTLGSICFFVFPASGDDIRYIQVQTREIEDSLKEKAAAELRAAREAAAKSRNRILKDRAALNEAINKLKKQAQTLGREIDSLSAENEDLTGLEADLSKKLADSGSMIKELSGVIRMNAKDIRSLVDDNLLAAVFHPKTDFLAAIASQSLFPGMEDIRKMTELLFDQIKRAGSVSIETASMVNRAGRQVESRILLIGCFTAAYCLEAETGFLNFTPGERKLYALPRLPPKGMQKKIKLYMDGKTEAVPMDISRGGALRQLTHELSLWEQIPKGGPIVWPILAILVLGGLIAAERIIFLLFRRIKLDRIFNKIENSAEKKKWETCRQTCERYSRNPVIRVIQAGLTHRHLPREEMENALQEAILKEIPPMERFLSTMGMLAAIAPLLGLLGTVTGMIDTFHVITMHGTGDPRMMSGGISEALVTTMLGLSVAIPIMLAHTLLSRSVENTIGQMEEKAVALINLVQKHQVA
ncbi:MotA/TolQ/ExbB proton channel family protein [Desulfospira joergensenii]|uniref:MotA/TolQ/ExbB proton channel family protein n=1 Tax=Desulfospira joergensenii TaxID=53329 RepID=UPI0003B2FD6A|nr:MotA/TolQ/ExbB proton channel family protein [Desulfospira joergensenii]